MRRQLPGFSYVLISSTHNHEGPDTLGLWGPSPFKSGVNPAYMKLVQEQIIKAVNWFEQHLVLEHQAGVLTKRLGYTVKAGEPYYTAACANTMIP